MMVVAAEAPLMVKEPRTSRSPVTAKSSLLFVPLLPPGLIKAKVYVPPPVRLMMSAPALLLDAMMAERKVTIPLPVPPVMTPLVELTLVNVKSAVVVGVYVVGTTRSSSDSSSGR